MERCRDNEHLREERGGRLTLTKRGRAETTEETGREIVRTIK